MVDAEKNMGRRVALGALAAAGATLTGAATTSRTAEADPTAADGRKARETFKVVDKRGRQRFLLSATKPPLIIDGTTIPADRRSGPENGSYFIFNDENGDEKGGLLVSPTGGHIAFDYPHAVDGIRLTLKAENGKGGAGLEIKGVPDPSGGSQAQAVPRAALGAHTAFGAQLMIADSQGRPRIVLQVDEHDQPTIKVLDEQGAVIKQLF